MLLKVPTTSLLKVIPKRKEKSVAEATRVQPIDKLPALLLLTYF